MKASYNDKDLLSVQKSIMETEGWLTLADVQDGADSVAAASSFIRPDKSPSSCFDGIFVFVFKIYLPSVTIYKGSID